jgi:hypothetical protein
MLMKLQEGNSHIDWLVNASQVRPTNRDLGYESVVKSSIINTINWAAVASHNPPNPKLLAEAR